MRHINIPVFIPHLGCPCRCVFCDQTLISGSFTPESDGALLSMAKESVEKVLAKRRMTGFSPEKESIEIAFFGGSFTAIPRPLMLAMLDMAKGYLRAGEISGIRLSTRPDCLSEEILDILEDYGAFDVEIGVQSLSDEVLRRNDRGHFAADSLDALARMRRRGCFRPVGQMMLGLPGSTLQSEWETARVLCGAGIAGARIYPTAVLAGSRLADLYQAGSYTPLTVEEAAGRAGEILDLLLNEGIPCLRIGLPAEEGLEHGTVLAGAYHPALGEMAWGACYRKRIERALPETPLPGDRLTVTVPRGRASAAAGYGGGNRRYFLEKYRLSAFRIRESDALSQHTPLLCLERGAGA